MTPRWVVGALIILAFSAPALGQVSAVVWDDPTLSTASRDADLIVLAQAEKVASNGVAYRVERTLKGPKRDGDLLAVTGLHHPELRERPPIDVGDRAFLLLLGAPDGEGFSLPTPTFGRFVVRGEEAVLSLGGADTFVRIRVPAERCALVLQAFAAGKAPELLAWARRVLAQEEAPGEEVYLALEVLGQLGAPKDALLAAAALKSDRWVGAGGERVRMSAARALGLTGGERGARTLIALAASKSERAAVVSVALAQVPAALGDPPSPEAVRAVGQKLAKLAPSLRTHPIRYGDAKDPRKNFVDSPLKACLVSLARLRSSAGAGPALRALETEDLEAIQAGLAYFERLGDAARALDVAERMRPAGHRDVFVNRTFGVSLHVLTGQAFGDDREAWVRWCKAQAPAGPDPMGPRRPGRDE